jgi:hypothetical protein
MNSAPARLDDRRATRLFLACVFCIAIAATATAGVLVSSGRVTNDWTSFYGAGELVRTGHASELYDASAQAAVQHRLAGPDINVTGYPLPTFAACLFSLLSLVSLRTSYVLWLAINLVLISMLLGLSWRWLADMPRSLRSVFLICALVLTLRSLLLGQVDLFVVAGLVGCYAMLRSERPVAAGLILSMGLFKPHLIAAAVLLLLVKREWRALGGFTAAGGPLLVLPPLIGGPPLLIDQLRALVSFNGSGKGTRLMINIRAAVETLTGSSNVWLWMPLLVLIAAVALYVAVRVWSGRSLLHPQSWAVAFALPLLYSPHVHMQSLVLLVPAAGLYLLASQLSALPIVSFKYVLYGLVVVTMLWALTYAGLALMILPIMAAYAVFSLRWPEPAAALERLPDRGELALAS